MIASVVYDIAKKTNFNWVTDDIRVLLIGGTSLPDTAFAPALSTVAAILAVSGVTELNATNYARQTTTRSETQDDANTRADHAISAAVTWTALGGAANDTIQATLYYKYVAGGDANCIPIALARLTTPLSTNGSNIVQNAGDIMRTA